MQAQSVKDPALDAVISRLSKIPSFHIKTVAQDGTTLHPWYEVTGAIVQDLVVTDASAPTQVHAVPGQIAHWGRLVAVAKRVWDIEEREYRQWRDYLQIKYSQPPEDLADELRAKWKKPSEETIAAQIRTTDGYRDKQIAIEAAVEAYNAATVVLEGFRAQAQLLRLWAFRPDYGNQPPEMRV